MINDQRAKELIDAHLAQTECEACKALAACGLEVTKCSTCGWDMMEAELASTNPDIDVVITKVISTLKHAGWLERKKTAKSTSFKSPIGVSASIAQLIIGKSKSNGYMIGYNPRGYIDGVLIKSVDGAISSLGEMTQRLGNTDKHIISSEVLGIVNDNGN